MAARRAVRAAAIALAALALTAAAPPPPPKKPPPLEALFGGPFALTDHNGRTVTDGTFRGRFTLLYFGYTFCPDLCPTNLLTMAEAVEALGPEQAERVQPLFVTVDPERDDPAALRDYMAHFGPRFLGLRGTPAQTRAVLKAWRIHRRKVPSGAGADADDYLVDHATLTFLMGPDGRFRTLFPHDTRAEKMTATLRRYLAAER
ncbi:MAG: SCO family protein [Alphaproteobacteria bacterium]|nr:SCO family protein [Alphaproteobacteria bacterium]